MYNKVSNNMSKYVKEVRSEVEQTEFLNDIQKSMVDIAIIRDNNLKNTNPLDIYIYI